MTIIFQGAPVMTLNVDAIDDRLRALDSKIGSSLYMKRLRSTETRLASFLASLPYVVTIHSATPNDIRKFLVWNDSCGKTKVHTFDCPRLGQPGLQLCACPLRLSAGSVQNLIKQVSDIYVQLGRGNSWDGSVPSGNPALSPLLKSYVKLVKEEQAQAHVLPRQAKPMFLSKLSSIFSYIDRQLSRPDLSLREKFVLARDQAFFKVQFFAGDRASDVCNILSQDVKALPDDSGFVFRHTFGKTLRGNNNTNVFVIKTCQDEQVCAVRGLMKYFRLAKEWKVDLSNGYLFRPVLENGVVLNQSLSFSAIYDRLLLYLTTLNIYDGETLHSLRSGYALTLAMSSAEVSAQNVMQHVGWRTANSAKYYCRSYLLRDASTTASRLDDAVSHNAVTEKYFRNNADLTGFKSAFTFEL